MRYYDMDAYIESKIQSEIKRRVIARSASVQKEKDTLLDTQYTLEALHELTGLPLAEIEKIAKEVRESFSPDIISSFILLQYNSISFFVSLLRSRTNLGNRLNTLPILIILVFMTANCSSVVSKSI